MNSKLFATFALIYNLIIFCNCDGSVVKPDVGLSPLNLHLPPHLRTFHHTLVGNPVKRNGEGTEHDYSDYYYQEQDEPECQEDQFWHIRGLKCVPFDCPGGNQYRNQHTGECLLSRYGVSEDSKGRFPSRFLNRNKSPTKFRLPFGLTLKG